MFYRLKWFRTTAGLYEITFSRDVASSPRSTANLWRPRQTGAKWRRKNRIFRTFWHSLQRIVSPTSRQPISLKFEHSVNPCGHEFFRDRNQWVNLHVYISKTCRKQSLDGETSLAALEPEVSHENPTILFHSFIHSFIYFCYSEQINERMNEWSSIAKFFLQRVI